MTTPEMRSALDFIKVCTDKYMENVRLAPDEVEKCREAILYASDRGVGIPRRSLGMRIEYDFHVPKHLKVIK